MKKIVSVASLGIRLTARHVLALFAVVGGFQGLCFYLQLKERVYSYDAFEYMLQKWPAWMGIGGLVALVFLLQSAMVGSKRSKTSYTLRRLQLSEGSYTAIFALIFAGYFVLYWAFQIVMCLAMYAMYTEKVGVVENLLFVSAFRAQYFHNLLPLYEPWALVRNGVVCVCFGSFAALSARNARNGRGAPLLMFAVALFFGMILYPHQIAVQTNDISLSVIMLICLALDIIWTRRWHRNEEN